jgi:hypothetical protein
VPLVWRGHYVAALLEPSTVDIVGPLEDKGFEVIAFGGDDTAWATSLDRLAQALGRPA